MTDAGSGIECGFDSLGEIQTAMDPDEAVRLEAASESPLTRSGYAGDDDERARCRRHQSPVTMKFASKLRTQIATRCTPLTSNIPREAKSR